MARPAGSLMFSRFHGSKEQRCYAPGDPFFAEVKALREGGATDWPKGKGPAVVKAPPTKGKERRAATQSESPNAWEVLCSSKAAYEASTAAYKAALDEYEKAEVSYEAAAKAFAEQLRTQL